jgi:cyanate permease
LDSSLRARAKQSILSRRPGLEPGPIPRDLSIEEISLFGFSVGNLITLPPLIIHREFSAASFVVVMGLSNAISGIIGAFGPVLVGMVRGWTGDYGAALALCIVLELVAAAIVVQRGRLSWRPTAAEGRG